MSWDIDFISKEDLTEHIWNTVLHYGEKLKSYDLEKFNSNIIDPIKMLFDKYVYGQSWTDLINAEIFRQRDKSNTNEIGYFHQKIFHYIDNCEVPDTGWDVIYQDEDGYEISPGNTVHTIFAEIKNKHNTMNSASSNDTYIKMQNQLLYDDDCACFLVEAIATKSQNIVWSKKIRNAKMEHARIRRVSMDKFYEITTKDKNGFFKICKVIPGIIQDLIVQNEHLFVMPVDTVEKELIEMSKEYRDDAMIMAMYSLGFGTYNGFTEK